MDDHHDYKSADRKLAEPSNGPLITTRLSYAELRNKNLEDNRIALTKLIGELKNSPGGLPKVGYSYESSVNRKFRTSKRRTSSPVFVRRNPTRASRPESGVQTRRSFNGKVQHTESPDDLSDHLIVKFAMFAKHRRAVDKMITDKESRSGFYKEADDITDDDLKLVALSVSDKVYDSVAGTTCQCRQKTDDLKTICRNKQCLGVRGQFCGPCLRNRYGEDIRITLKDSNWNCPPCRGICNCSFCRRKKGKSCTGILIHVARENGYNSVSEYLDSLKSK